MKSIVFAILCVVFFGGCSEKNTEPSPEQITSAELANITNISQVYSYIVKQRTTPIYWSSSLSTMLSDSIVKILNGKNRIANSSTYAYYIGTDVASADRFIIEAEKHRKAYSGTAYNPTQQGTYGMYTQIAWKRSEQYAALLGKDNKGNRFFVIATYPSGNNEGELP